MTGTDSFSVVLERTGISLEGWEEGYETLEEGGVGLGERRALARLRRIVEEVEELEVYLDRASKRWQGIMRRSRAAVSDLPEEDGQIVREDVLDLLSRDGLRLAGILREVRRRRRGVRSLVELTRSNPAFGMSSNADPEDERE